MDMHERPGVYSAYDAVSAVNRSTGGKTVGLVGVAEEAESNQVITLNSYGQCVESFGAESTMSELAKLLFLNGAAVVKAVAVEEVTSSGSSGVSYDYEAAFAALECEDDVEIVVCDSDTTTVQQVLRSHLEDASQSRHERIAVVGAAGSSTVSQCVQHAAALNSERMVLVAPGVLSENGTVVSSMYAAAAFAGVIAGSRDPAIPLHGVVLKGLNGLAARYSDGQIDTLVQGGVTPLESVNGEISAVRCVTTKLTTDGEEDLTWHELSTILIADNVIPAIRRALRSRFVRTKNTAQTRSAVRSQVIVELENKLAAQMIDSYGEVLVSALAEDPTVCQVEFGFTVAHGLNQIHLMAHITV